VHYNTLPVGLLRDFPTEKAAWREVDRLGLLVRINSEESGTRIRFDALAEHYLKADFGEDAGAPKVGQHDPDRGALRSGLPYCPLGQ
jgi:hypothetical protein